MKNAWIAVKNFARDEEGATAIEYGMMIALIAAVIIAAVATIGQEVSKGYDAVKDCLVKKGVGC